MTSGIIVRRLYDGADSSRHFLSSILDEWSTINNLYAPDDPELPEYHDPDFAGCYNGLVCLQYDNCEYAFWNPSTNEFKLLPRTCFQDHPCPFKSCNGNCTVSTRSDVTCLGFDTTSQDYKFVAFIEIHYEVGDDCHYSSEKVAIYSLKDNSWKEIQYPGPHDMVDGDATRVKNEFCYWKCFDLIVSFSFITEEFSTIPYPDIVLDRELHDYQLLLVEFDGSLGAVVHPRLGNVKLFSFWVWGGGLWTRKMKFDVRLVGAQRPLGWFGNNFLFEGIDGELLEYDYSKHELNLIDQVYDYPLAMTVFPYVEMTTPQLNGKIARATLEKKTGKESKRQRQMTL